MSDSTDKMDEAVAAVKEIVKESTGIQLTSDDGRLVESKVASLLAGTGLSFEKFKELAGLTPPRSLIPIETAGITRYAEEKSFMLYGKKVSEQEAISWQVEHLKDYALAIKLPDDIKLAASRLKEFRKTMDKDVSAMTRDFEKMGYLGPIEKLKLPSTPEGLMPLGDTAVTVREGGAYRAPGKQRIEDVLAEAGMEYDILLRVRPRSDDLTRAQQDVIGRLNEEHLDITFLHDRVRRIEIDLSCCPEPPKKIGFFRRLWMGIVIRFGMAAAATSETTKELNK